MSSHKDLSIREIVGRNLAYTLTPDYYAKNGVELIENTPEEIRDIVIEMMERLDNTWNESDEDKELQEKFWNLFPKNEVDHRGRRFHGEIRARFGASYLRNNKDWLI